MAASQNTLTTSSGDLVDLVSSSGSATIYPSDDAILAVLKACFRADLPYTRIGCTNLLVVNPYKALATHCLVNIFLRTRGYQKISVLRTRT